MIPSNVFAKIKNKKKQIKKEEFKCSNKDIIPKKKKSGTSVDDLRKSICNDKAKYKIANSQKKTIQDKAFFVSLL